MTKRTGCGSRPIDRVQRAARLTEREVERRALERPAPVQAVGRELRRGGEEVERAYELDEAAERRAPGERLGRPGGLEGVLVVVRVRDVLADALLAAPVQVHDGGHARELGGDRLLEPLELVALDHQRQLGERSRERHAVLR